MDRHDTHESHLLPYNYLECPSWRYRQSYHLASFGCSPFVQDSPGDFGGSFFRQARHVLLRCIGHVRAVFQELIDGNQLMTVQARRRMHQASSSFGFVKIWISVCSSYSSTRICPPQLFSF